MAFKRKAIPEVRSTDPYDFQFKKVVREILVELQDQAVLFQNFLEPAYIFGSPTNLTTVDNSFATSLIGASALNLSFTTDRIVIQRDGLYNVFFNTISNQVAARRDAYIYKNGATIAQALMDITANASFQQRTLSITLPLAAGDYIQFWNANWYNNTNTAFDQWRTAGVAMVRPL